MSKKTFEMSVIIEKRPKTFEMSINIANHKKQNIFC